MVMIDQAQLQELLQAKKILDAQKATEKAAADDKENLMPYLVDCCHAYATVGEMDITSYVWSLQSIETNLQVSVSFT